MNGVRFVNCSTSVSPRSYMVLRGDVNLGVVYRTGRLASLPCWWACPRPGGLGTGSYRTRREAADAMSGD